MTFKRFSCLWFTDVVAAYKGLAKEKEALEISLKALNKSESPADGGTNIKILIKCTSN